MTHSESLNELAAALAKAQGQIKGAVKDAQNPFFKSKYADLSSVWDACREPLSANGLSILQPASTTTEGVRVVTMLLHASGQWITEELTMKPVKDDPQGVGSCISYARRYALSAMVGIAPEEDDGNAASTKPTGIAMAARVTASLIPPGYDAWLAVLAATAEEGTVALDTAWSQSKGEFKNYLRKTNDAGWEALRTLAATRVAKGGAA